MSRLSIYFTSDTHAYLYPTNFASRKPLPMGLLGMRFPKDGNTLVIDGGDTIQGSPMTYYAHAYGVELPIARAMNARGYDYFTLGNHDFNYGREHLKKYLDEMEAVCLCANVTDLKGEMKLFPSAVRVMENGLRVGLVGICTDWVNRWERPENLTGLTVSDPLEAAAEAARKLDCDVLVGIYHGGIERDLNTGRLLSETDENIACRICEKVPFDLLLTGHQHIGLAITYHLHGQCGGLVLVVSVDVGDVIGMRLELSKLLQLLAATHKDGVDKSVVQRTDGGILGRLVGGPNDGHAFSRSSSDQMRCQVVEILDVSHYGKPKLVVFMLSDRKITELFRNNEPYSTFYVIKHIK